jgi:carbon-monoxide dehydrogenase small subunit
MGNQRINVTVNGESISINVPPNITLLRMLRERLGLTGTKLGCEDGECGACTVLVNEEPVNSCMMLAVEANDSTVVTVEGLVQDEELVPIQDAFIKYNAFQCGFCTPGMLITAHALIQRMDNPSEDDIKAALVGNLCRCTGYLRIIRAIQSLSGTHS